MHALEYQAKSGRIHILIQSLLFECSIRHIICQKPQSTRLLPSLRHWQAELSRPQAANTSLQLSIRAVCGRVSQIKYFFTEFFICLNALLLFQRLFRANNFNKNTKLHDKVCHSVAKRIFQRINTVEFEGRSVMLLKIMRQFLFYLVFWQCKIACTCVCVLQLPGLAKMCCHRCN